jgi:hypothetical protein
MSLLHGLGSPTQLTAQEAADNAAFVAQNTNGNMAAGIFKAGDVIRFIGQFNDISNAATGGTGAGGRNDAGTAVTYNSDAYMIKEVDETGLIITLTEKVTFTTTDTISRINKVHRPVTVKRTGWAAAVPQKVRLTTFSDRAVTAGTGGNGGYYALKLTHDGNEAKTSCIPYGADASTMKTAIETVFNSAGGTFDFNKNSLADEAGHVTVSRTGDGTFSSGYGYVYEFVFEGHASVDGVSSVLGSNAPTIEIINEGSINGCDDVGGTETVLSVGTATTTTNSNTLTMSSSVNGYVSAGDRIKIQDSNVAAKQYFVSSVSSNGLSVSLTEIFVGSSYGASKAVTVVDGGIPIFSVETVEAGLDAYTYDIFFTGDHLSNVGDLTVTSEGSGACTGWKVKLKY